MLHLPSSEFIIPPHDPEIGLFLSIRPIDKAPKDIKMTTKLIKKVFMEPDHTIFLF
jgi:hypothetical protein